MQQTHSFVLFCAYPMGGFAGKGSGRGLAIVRHLVEMHGGTVRADSHGVGRGTTFTVEMPA